MRIKAVLVDDEQIAREVLSNYIVKYCPSVELIGQAEGIREAVPMIKELQPQLVFLDVEMPYGNAFDILEACEETRFETIFVTAYAEYSLRALNMSAAYYILKPIDITELVTAVNKVHDSIQRNEEFDRTKLLLQNLKSKPDQQQIILPTVNGFDVVKTSTITRLQANGNFTDVHFTDGSRRMICKFLKHFDETLEDPFIRIHRSYIVNLNFIKSYSKGAGGFVIMEDGSEIEVSASYKEKFIGRFTN